MVKRRVADAVLRQLVADGRTSKWAREGQVGTSLSSSVVSSTPRADSSDRPQPGPATEPTTLPEAVRARQRGANIRASTNRHTARRWKVSSPSGCS